MRGSSHLFDSPSMVWGMKDIAFGPAILDRWTAAFPHARFTPPDDAGHWPHEEQPEATAGAVLEALRDATRPPRPPMRG